MSKLLQRACLAAALLAGGAAAAQNVTLNGHLSDKMALLIIDGLPRTVSIGQTVQGVKLLALADGDARVDVAGRQLVLRIGAAPVRLGAAAKDGAGTDVVLTAGTGGHFVTGGSINGSAVQFMVDTGATSVAISQADAERIGLAYRNAPRGLAQTAGGTVPVYRVRLNSVRVGDVEVYDVEATVIAVQLPYILLDNSYLTRFQMKRENDTLTLSKRL